MKTYNEKLNESKKKPKNNSGYYAKFIDKSGNIIDITDRYLRDESKNPRLLLNVYQESSSNFTEMTFFHFEQKDNGNDFNYKGGYILETNIPKIDITSLDYLEGFKFTCPKMEIVILGLLPNLNTLSIDVPINKLIINCLESLVELKSSLKYKSEEVTITDSDKLVNIDLKNVIVGEFDCQYLKNLKTITIKEVDNFGAYKCKNISNINIEKINQFYLFGNDFIENLDLPTVNLEVAVFYCEVLKSINAPNAKEFRHRNKTNPQLKMENVNLSDNCKIREG